MAKIRGTNGNDILIGTAGNDTIHGRRGDDTLYGGKGHDRLFGELGKDTLHGGVGNDWLDAGGIGRLYGEQGNDLLTLNPGPVDVGRIDLSGNVFDGGDGIDTLRITNNTTYSDAYFPSQPGSVLIIPRSSTDPEAEGFSLHFGPVQEGLDEPLVGTILGIERIEASGHADNTGYGLDYLVDPTGYGGIETSPDVTIAGTAHPDNFDGGPGSETFIGRAGNDDFRTSPGNDVFVSEIDDTDRFLIGSATGTTVITGFNGAGLAEGDTLSLAVDPAETPVTIAEDGEATRFSWTWFDDDGAIQQASVTVDAIDLAAGLDYTIA